MISYAVVIPTIGRPGLAQLVATVDGDPAPACIVVADDRRDAAAQLDLPATTAPLIVVRTHGRGPAAARNAGWRATDADWIAFLDDDVAIPLDWCRRLVEDLDGLPDNVAASQAWIFVPTPEGRPPTDAERRTTNLSGALWITADMAYRRSALLASGGFDERFPRAFREDADLALRTVRLGYAIVWGERVTTHPLASSAWLAQQPEGAGGQCRQCLDARQIWASLALADRNVTREDRPPPARHCERDCSPGGSGRQGGCAYPGSLGPHRNGGRIGLGRVDGGVRRRPNPPWAENCS